MSKIVEINILHNGSTGKIMLGIADVARAAGHQVWTFSPKRYSRHGKVILPEIPGHTYFSSVIGNAAHILLGKYTGLHGCFSIFGTLGLLRQLDKIKPDIIHLHNLHGFIINIPLLFGYIKRHNIPTVWTLHDCWAFTGHCPHFTMVGCNRWQSGCHDCPQLRSYPKSYVDRSRFMWKLKRKCFTGVEKLTIVTPSEWLAGLVKQSFLKDYPVKVINNGIDLSIFKPTESSFRRDHGIREDEFMLLGVSFGWSNRKGVDVFIELAGRLPQNCRIVLVGTNEDTDKLLPENIISIHQTDNQTQLAEIYSAADLFINPTREETFPTVNMEALACGTPVVTFNTGGSPEIIDDSCGAVVKSNTIEELIDIIADFQSGKLSLSASSCLRRALNFSYTAHYEDYLNLYHLFSRNKM